MDRGILVIRHSVSFSADLWRQHCVLTGKTQLHAVCYTLPVLQSEAKWNSSSLFTEINNIILAGHIDVDCKDLTSRYANDVIASCAFGLKVNSHTDEENQFYEMGKLASEFKLRQMLVFLVLSACPVLVKVRFFFLWNSKYFPWSNYIIFLKTIFIHWQLKV